MITIGLNSPLIAPGDFKEVKGINTHDIFLEPPEELRRPIAEVYEDIKDAQTTVDTKEVEPVNLIEPVPEQVVTSKGVCDTGADFASWMDYRTLTNTSSKQYELQTHAETTGEGLRQVNGLTLIAINARYGAVGDKLTITFIDGHMESFIIGDLKANTDCTHPVGNGRSSLIEIIVDSNLIDKSPGEIIKYSKKIVDIR